MNMSVNKSTRKISNRQWEFLCPLFLLNFTQHILELFYKIEWTLRKLSLPSLLYSRHQNFASLSQRDPLKLSSRHCLIFLICLFIFLFFYHYNNFYLHFLSSQGWRKVWKSEWASTNAARRHFPAVPFILPKSRGGRLPPSLFIPW